MATLTVPAITIQIPPHVTVHQMREALDVIGCDLKPDDDGRNFVCVKKGKAQGRAQRHLRRTAEKARKRWEYQGGYVILKGDELAGWVLHLDAPQSWPTGVVAIDENGLMWIAKGGNAYDGAESWEPVDRDSRVVRLPFRQPTPPGAA